MCTRGSRGEGCSTSDGVLYLQHAVQQIFFAFRFHVHSHVQEENCWIGLF